MAITDLADEEKVGSLPPSQSRDAYGTPSTRWFLAVGVLLLTLLLWKTRLEGVGELLWKASFAFPLLFLPYALVVAFEAVGWWFAFPFGRSPRFNTLLRLTVAAKAVQFLTPSIIQAGEFMKVHLLRQNGVKVEVAVASVVVAKTTMMIGELLFIGSGLSLALGSVAVEPAIALSVTVGLVVMALSLMGVLLLQRAGLFRPLVILSRLIPLLTAFIDRHKGFLSSTERIVQAQLDEKRRFARSCLWFFIGWAAGIVEVWVFFAILGLPTNVPSALFVQVWSLVVTRLTTFIPGNVGAQEAGTVMTFSFLGLSTESAIAFAVLRRLRQLGWIGASLGCMTRMPHDQAAERDAGHRL